jgi:hypothetical protein
MSECPDFDTCIIGIHVGKMDASTNTCKDKFMGRRKAATVTHSIRQTAGRAVGPVRSGNPLHDMSSARKMHQQGGGGAVRTKLRPDPIRPDPTRFGPTIIIH